MVPTELEMIRSRVIEIINLIKTTNFKSSEILDLDLFELEILDSFAVLELISKLELEFEVQIPVEDLNMQNLSTVSSISQYLLSRR